MNELPRVTEALLIFMIITSLLTKVIRYATKKEMFLVLDEILRSIKIDMNKENNRRDVKQAVKICLYFGRAYKLIMTMGIISNLFLPILNDNNRILPLAMWTPWSIEPIEIYCLTFTWHMLVICNGTVTNVTADLMSNKLMVILICHLKLLGNDIRRIDFKKRDGSVEIQIRKCIATHKLIIQ